MAGPRAGSSCACGASCTANPSREYFHEQDNTAVRRTGGDGAGGGVVYAVPGAQRVALKSFRPGAMDTPGRHNISLFVSSQYLGENRDDTRVIPYGK